MHMGVTPSTMSITIERLLKLGYVRAGQGQKGCEKNKPDPIRQGAKIKGKHSFSIRSSLPPLYSVFLKKKRSRARWTRPPGLCLGNGNEGKKAWARPGIIEILKIIIYEMDIHRCGITDPGHCIDLHRQAYCSLFPIRPLSAALLPMPATQAWTRLTDFSKYPEWRKNIKKVEVSSPE